VKFTLVSGCTFTLEKERVIWVRCSVVMLVEVAEVEPVVVDAPPVVEEFVVEPDVPVFEPEVPCWAVPEVPDVPEPC
jgi:hypothetical protein